jgi:peptidoglycan/xylan/chitin deacetylase (PgdA/CDA1 family)
VPVVWSNDDIACGDAPRLERMLAFLDRHGVPGTFFLIPRGSRGDLDQDDALLRLIAAARRRGHEFQQHGCRHTAFECGIPELRMLDWSAPERRRFDEERERIEAGHTRAALVRMVDEGRRVWRRAFGEDPAGFRPGWGAWCGDLYHALADLGYAWVSARIPSMTAWNRQNGAWDEAMEFRPGIPSAPVRLAQGIVEIPMAGDYAFRVPMGRLADMQALARAEFADAAARGAPMVLVSHWHGLEFPGGDPGVPGGSGYAVHEALVPWLLADGRARFTSMAELAAGVPAP